VAVPASDGLLKVGNSTCLVFPFSPEFEWWEQLDESGVEMGMTNIVVTQAAVRNMATAFSKVDSSQLRHGDRLALIAEAFGWKADAFMHSLKESRGKPATKSDTANLLELDANLWGKPHELNDLGIRQSVAWKRIVDQQSGVMVVTGATGSGRTTTLVSTAQFLAGRGRRVVVIGPDGSVRDLQEGDVVLYGAIRDGSTAKAAYDLAENGHLVLVIMARTPDSNLHDLLRWGVSSRQLELTRAVLLQFLVRKLAHHPGLEVDGSERYKGRAVVSCLDCFDEGSTVASYMKQTLPWEIEIISDLSSKLANGIIDMTSVEYSFGEKYCSILEGLLPSKRLND
jgi:hypothetical protein